MKLLLEWHLRPNNGLRKESGYFATMCVAHRIFVVRVSTSGTKEFSLLSTEMPREQPEACKIFWEIIHPPQGCGDACGLASDN